MIQFLCFLDYQIRNHTIYQQQKPTLTIDRILFQSQYTYPTHIKLSTMPLSQSLSKLINCQYCMRRDRIGDSYQFQINSELSPHANHRQFDTNFIRTTKYTIFSFLPKALLLQFTRLANCYFLIIAILLSIKVISPLSPFTAWAPLIIVIGISMTREAYQDYHRYKTDKIVNYKSFTRVIRDGREINDLKWSQVIVGDICIVTKDQTFPADLILLKSSFQNGTAFIETASLDGEKNLKPRNAFKQTATLTQQQLKSLHGRITCPLPNPQLHLFSATMTINNFTIYIEGDKQLLYRGTKLRNTELIYGLVIYTGKNTKIMKNSEIPLRNKMSQVEIKVNYILAIILVIQVVFCSITAIFYGVYRNQIINSYYYVDWTSYSSAADSIIVFLTYLVLLNTMIPISLIVSIQIVKMFQKYFIDQDKFLFSEWRKTGVSVKSASLNEQLGQIEYVFSDKTGTLTKNLMEFKIAVIGKSVFGDVTLISPQRDAGVNKDLQYGFHDQRLREMLKDQRLDQALGQEIVIRNGQGQQKLTLKTLRQAAHQYLLTLSLAHEVVAQHNDSKTTYQGPSPDQISLVQAAKQMNYQFVASSQDITIVKVLGRQYRYEVLGVFPFTSERKRMSIVVRDPQKNLIRMYSKGADSIIKQRLAKDNHLDLQQELTKFSLIGLRTLLIATRVVSEHQWQTYQNSIAKLQLKNRDSTIAQLQSKLENKLYLIGATAVLDRLQDQVPETIRDLLRANVKVWMLTGDKMETAQNIARSCNLIQKDFQVLRYIPQSTLTSENPQQIINIPQYLTSLIKQAEELKSLSLPKSLLIEGTNLNSIVDSEEAQKLFSQLGSMCESVVCCRLLPSQKREIVKIVRTHMKKITLAVGDGANDIAMIKQAHIGIGLYGQEGMGAVQASDYALPQFRMLWRLLFVHGRWNYIRISEMILYFFYKNMLFTIPQFIAAFYCAYSGQTLFDDVYVALYNLIFTALPLIVRAVLQQDVNYMFKQHQQLAPFPPIVGVNMMEQQKRLPEHYHVNKYYYRLFPKIYFIGQEECIFNYRNYFSWIIQGMIEATIITVFVFQILSQPSINEKGYNSDFWLVGEIVYTAVIFVVTLKLCTHTRFWSAILFWTIVLTSLGSYLAYMWISNYVFSYNVQGVTYIAWTSGECYFIVLFCICMILLVDGSVVFIDFRKGGMTSRLREIVYQEKVNNREFFSEMNVSITSGLTLAGNQSVNGGKEEKKDENQNDNQEREIPR